ARGDQRDPRGTGGKRRLDDPSLLVAACKTGCRHKRPNGEQNRERVKAAKFNVSTNGVRAERRWKQGHQLRGERGHRRTECRPRARSCARDLIEAGGLRENQEQGREREANDAPRSEERRVGKERRAEVPTMQ